MIIEIVIARKKDRGKTYSIKHKSFALFEKQLDIDFHAMFCTAIKLMFTKPSKLIEWCAGENKGGSNA